MAWRVVCCNLRWTPPTAPDPPHIGAQAAGYNGVQVDHPHKKRRHARGQKVIKRLPPNLWETAPNVCACVALLVALQHPRAHARAAHGSAKSALGA